MVGRKVGEGGAFAHVFSASGPRRPASGRLSFGSGLPQPKSKVRRRAWAKRRLMVKGWSWFLR
ncbi:MAG: hypothetical protein AAFU79_17595, partial [Myxococcota bacterium]